MRLTGGPRAPWALGLALVAGGARAQTPPRAPAVPASDAGPPPLAAVFDARAAEVDAPAAFTPGVPWTPVVAVDWARGGTESAAAGAWVRTTWNRDGLRVALALPTGAAAARREGEPPFGVHLGFRSALGGGPGAPYEVRCTPVAEPLTRMLAERSQAVLFNARAGANARVGERGHVLCDELTLRGVPPARLRTRWRAAADDPADAAADRVARFDAFVPWAALGLAPPAAGSAVALRLAVTRPGAARLTWGDSAAPGAARLLAEGATPDAMAVRLRPLVAGAARQPAPVEAAFPLAGAAGASALTFALVDAAGRVRARAAGTSAGAAARARLATGGLPDGAYRVRVLRGDDPLGETSVRLVGGAAARLDAARQAAGRRLAALEARAATGPAWAAGHLARARAALAMADAGPRPDSAALARGRGLVADAGAVADAVAAGRRPDAAREGYAHPAGFAADGPRGPVRFVPVRGDVARVTVDVRRPAAFALTPRLYGTFSEPVHYDRPIYTDLDAERVRNPGFLWGHPLAEQTARDFIREREFDSTAARAALAGTWIPRLAASADSVAAPWIAVAREAGAGAVTFGLACDTAAGRACQRVTAAAGARGAGVAQLVTLPAWRATRYRLRAVLRGGAGPRGARAVLYHDGRAVDSASLGTSPGAPPGDAAWRAVDAELAAPRVAGAANTFLLAVLVDGPAAVELRKVSLRPADADGVFDPQAVAQLRALRTGWVRWPGGNYASGYRWRDGVGPRDLRPSTRNYSWPGLNDNGVGTDEFLQLAERAGFETLVTVNAGSGTPDEAAAWVQYVNGDSTTPMGRLRARHGRARPYGVRHWNVGNELWGHWQVGYTDPAGNAERYARFARAMRAADSSIVLVANAHGGHSESPPDAWNDALLRRNGRALEWLDLHTYVNVGPDSGLSAEDRAFLLSAVPLSYEQWIGALARDVRGRGLGHVRAIVGEYNGAVRTGSPAADRAGDLLAAAAYLHAFVRLGDFVVGANATEYSPFDPRALQFGRMHPRYDLFRTWAARLGTRPLAATVETPVVQQPRRLWRDVVPVFNLPLVDAVAARDTAAGAVSVSLVNRDMARARTVEVRLDGFAAGADARLVVLRPEPGVGMDERPLAAAAGTWTVTLPPRSAALLTVPPAGAAPAAGAGTSGR